MNYPLVSEYIEAIKLAEENLDKFSYLRPVLDEDGFPVMNNENYAVVFKMRDERNGDLYALKCFLKNQEGRADAYKLISKEQNNSLQNILVPMAFKEKELFVDTRSCDMTEFPVVLIDWIPGVTLDTFIQNERDKTKLCDVFFKFNRITSWLETIPLDSGKLRFSDFIVTPKGNLVLTNIDSMICPLNKSLNLHPVMFVSSVLNEIAKNPRVIDQFILKAPGFFSHNDFISIAFSSIPQELLDLSNHNLISTESQIYDSTVLKYLYLAYQDNADAQFIIGQCYYDGLGIEKDMAKAISWFRKAADNNEPRAQYKLGLCLYNGEGAKMDKKAAMNWFLLSAGQGYAPAQNHIANCYFYGKDINADRIEAFKWYYKAAQQHYAESQLHIGLCYYFGWVVQQNKSEAINWFHRAGYNGSITSQILLALYFLELNDQNEDHDSMFWILMAAKQNNPIAMFHMGNYHYNLYRDFYPEPEYWEPETSPTIALKWYRQAENSGHIFAQLKIAELYGWGGAKLYSDIEETKLRLQKAQKLGYCKEIEPKDYMRIEGFIKSNIRDYEHSIVCREFAERGLPEAQFYLGSCYEKGKGIPQNQREAAKWHLRAAHQGYLEAQLAIGLCFLFGRGVVPDLENAIIWFKKAAQQGSTEAQFFIGYCYSNRNCDNNEENDKNASMWYRLAMEQQDFINLCSRKIYVEYDVCLCDFILMLRKEALKGDVDAQLWLGDWYRLGYGKIHDINESITWYMKAANQGHADAMYGLGCCYSLDNHNQMTNYDEAIKWFHEAAKRGSTNAMISIGKSYVHSYGVKKNDNEALKWFSKAAKHGNAEAQNILGEYYTYSHSWERWFRLPSESVTDHKKAVKLFQASAKQGNSMALYNLGQYYENGFGGLEQNIEEAMKLYRAAAEQGNPQAMRRIGEVYLFDNDYKNAILAEEWLKKASALGDYDARKYLDNFFAIYYRYNNKSDKKEIPPDGESIIWYEKAAEQGNADAQFHLAQCYQHGLVPGRDPSQYSTIVEEYKQALKWYRKASEQGHCESQLQLGLLLDNSISDDYYYESERKDDKRNYEAFTWITIAAKQGHAEAQFYMGKYYEYGIFVKQSDQLAIEWYHNAAKRGSANAQYKLADCYRNGIYVPKNDSLAIKLYRISAEQGHCKAQFQLGDIYEQGSCGVERSREEALNWYKLAAVQEGPEAKEAKRRLLLLIFIRDKYRKHN